MRTLSTCSDSLVYQECLFEGPNFSDIGFVRYHVLGGLIFGNGYSDFVYFRPLCLSLLNRTYADFVLCFSISRPFWETMFVILFVESTITKSIMFV